MIIHLNKRKKVMKKNILMTFIFILSFCIQAACIIEDEKEKLVYESSKNSEKDAFIGVLSEGSDYKGANISWFDKDLNKVGTLEFDFIGIGNTWENTPFDDNNIYIAPCALGNTLKNYRFFIALDRKTLIARKIPRELTGVHTINQLNGNVYQSNSMKGKNPITKINVKTAKLEKTFYAQDYIKAIFSDNKYLYAHCDNVKEDKNEIFIYKFDEDLNVLKEFKDKELSDIGYKSTYDDKYIYFTGKSRYLEELKSYIVRIGRDDNKYEKRVLKYPYSNEIFLNKNKIYVYYKDLHDFSPPTKFSILDSFDAKEEKTVSVPYRFSYILLKDDKMYGLTKKELIILNADTFELIKKVDLSTAGGGKDKNGVVMGLFFR